MTVPVGSLRPGEEFVTRITGRHGIVLDGNRKHYGVSVALDRPDEERLLHEDVMVEAR